jgi:predicted small secreted protein
MKRLISLVVVILATGSFVLSGCDTGATKPAGKSAQGTTDDIAAERAKLSPEDRALVEAQEWCVVQNDERLGSMGPPIKLDIKGQPVFVCCKSCKTKAEKDPEATLAKVEELKARARSERGAK